MHPDFYSDTYRFDWSTFVLRASLVCSALMVSGSLIFRLTADMKTASNLREHGVQTCIELNRAPGATPLTGDTTFGSLCDSVVAERHDDCVGEARGERSTKQRERTYMACVMAGASPSAALHEDP